MKGQFAAYFSSFCFVLLYIYIYIYTYIFFLWLTLCSYISLEIMFVNLLTSTKWRSVIFFLFTLLILLNSNKINFSLRYSFPWFSFFSLEGSNEGLEWALPDIFSWWHHTSKFASLQNWFSLYVLTYMYFSWHFYIKLTPACVLSICR